MHRIRHDAWINGIQVQATYTAEEVQTLFLPMLQTLADMRDQRKRRILVMLAAPPGSGKSTLCSFLASLSHESSVRYPLQTIGMDGFHRRQEDLLAHTVERDGKTFPMTAIKGAPETFDLAKLSASVDRLAAGEPVSWPIYDRLLHNPVEDAIKITEEVILLEGNYLLLDQPGWRTLSKKADLTIFMRAPEALLRERLIQRRMQTGVEREAAENFVDFSDMPNAHLCLTQSLPSDITLALDAAGRLHA